MLVTALLTPQAWGFDVTLAWLPPTKNTDGSRLNDLWGYGLCSSDVLIPDNYDKLTCEVLYGERSTVTVSTSFDVTYYRVFALDYAGNSSALSNEAVADFNLPPEFDDIPPEEPPSKPSKPGLRVTDIAP